MPDTSIVPDEFTVSIVLGLLIFIPLVSPAACVNLPPFCIVSEFKAERSVFDAQVPDLPATTPALSIIRSPAEAPDCFQYMVPAPPY